MSQVNGNGTLSGAGFGDSVPAGAKLSKSGKLQPIQTRVREIAASESRVEVLMGCDRPE